MYVQNGDRPQWAWSGQHVEVASAWELRTAVVEVTNGAAAAGPPPVELLGEASGRPSWAWGGERAAAVEAAADAAPVLEVAPPVAPAVTASSDDRPAWSWGGGTVA